MNPSTALATTLVDELARLGVTDAVLAPGSRSAPLALACHRHPGLRLHVEIDERSAGFLAIGLARATGRPALVFTTSGSAAANLHPAVAEAHEARVPMLVVTADRPPELRATAANQTIDQLRLFSSVRWFAEVGVAEEGRDQARYWRSLASRACSEAVGAVVGAPGPVHLNAAFREPLVPGGDGVASALGGRPEEAPWTQATVAARPPDPADVEAVLRLVVASPRGVVVLGDGACARPAQAQAWMQLASAVGWPVLAEPTSNGRVPGPVVSAAHLLLSDPEFASAHAPAAALVAGKVGLSRPVLAMLEAVEDHILVDRDGAWLDPVRGVSRIVGADPALLAMAVADQVPPRRASAWLDGWLEAERRARDALDAALDADEAPSEPRTARDLAAAVPDRGALVVASSMPVRDLDLAMRPRAGLRLFANRGASGIDGFASLALGVALAHPGPTYALTGDLSLLHDQNGLLLADRPDLVMVVCNNDGGGIFALLPPAREEGFERLFATPHGLDLGRLAQLHGCGHRLLERAGELPAVVAAAAAEGGIQLVEVRTDRQANAELHERLRAVVRSA